MNGIVEVTGIGYPNKGAELMLCAVSEQVLGHWGNGVTIATRPTLGHDMGYRALTLYGCHQRASLVWKGIDIGTPLSNRLPKRLLRTYGVIAEKEIHVVLDASGFRYSDKWGLKTIQCATREYRRVKSRGGKVVLLPQAFGPFENSAIRAEMKVLHATADLLLARDPVSLGYLLDVLGTDEKIELKPDFTGLVKGLVPPDADNFRGKFAVIPNARMIDKTSSNVAENYIALLRSFIDECHAAGNEAFILNHEGAGDEKLCLQLLDAYQGRLSYSGIRAAKEVKGLISVASGVMTSRFHGLVSALMQGVPALCTSWNHKYECLLEDFSLEAYLADPSHGEPLMRKLFRTWFANRKSDQFERDSLVAKSLLVNQETVGMWSMVREICEVDDSVGQAYYD